MGSRSAREGHSRLLPREVKEEVSGGRPMGKDAQSVHRPFERGDDVPPQNERMRHRILHAPLLEIPDLVPQRVSVPRLGPVPGGCALVSGVREPADLSHEWCLVSECSSARLRCLCCRQVLVICRHQQAF
jgi:hypothetical protein